MNINAPEFTPKDIYELDFFAPRESVKKACEKNLVNGLCQLAGKVELRLEAYSFVKPYENMCQKCPTMLPKYERAKFC